MQPNYSTDYLEYLCLKLIPEIRAVGRFIQTEINKVSKDDIETKSLNSLVSYVDKEAERQLIGLLSKEIPSAGYLAEEGTGKSNNDHWQWIIDPLDGTTNFLHALPVYSISIALQYKNETVLGIVLEINQDECFYAWKDSSAYLNQKIIQVSQNELLQNSLLATGFPYYDFERIEAYFSVLKSLAQSSRGIRRLGSAAVDLAYVACGRFDSYFEYSLHPWDVAAGAFIVERAGGKVCDFKGANNWLYGKEIIASNNDLQTPLLNLIKEHHL